MPRSARSRPGGPQTEPTDAYAQDDEPGCEHRTSWLTSRWGGWEGDVRVIGPRRDVQYPRAQLYRDHSSALSFGEPDKTVALPSPVENSTASLAFSIAV